jgi:hypothetical protein
MRREGRHHGSRCHEGDASENAQRIPRAFSLEILIVETAGIEPASAVASVRRLRAYPAL